MTTTSPIVESERALAAALRVFTRLDGATVVEDGDLHRIASGRPYAAFNHVTAIRMADDDVERRVAEVGAALRASRSLPATWWTSPSTRPLDLAARLSALGLREEEPEYGMVIELDGSPRRVGVPRDIVLEELGADADLTGWTAVMADAYGWVDPSKAAAMADLYRRAPGDEVPWVHVLASRDGRGVASASLFTTDGHAFVTNVGTIPEARGQGLGSAMTSAALAIAYRMGFSRASLTASVMGRSMYAHLGFQDEVRIDRHVMGASDR
jgi:GNAT superfamily N-acetyltransferase